MNLFPDRTTTNLIGVRRESCLKEQLLTEHNLGPESQGDTLHDGSEVLRGRTPDEV